jgi:hypothetical protein
LHFEEHRVGSQVVLPASYYLSLAWSTFQAVHSDLPAFRVSDLAILRPLQPGKESVSIQTALSPLSGDGDGVRISSRRPGEKEWTLHATCRVQNGQDNVCSLQPDQSDQSDQSQQVSSQAEPAQLRGIDKACAQ